MWLPTKSQVDAASRHVITAASTAIAIFGLQAKGVDTQQVIATIQALGSTVNDMVVLFAGAGALYASLKASHTASPTSQAQAVAATGALVVGSPELAAATPADKNIVSRDTVAVVQR